MNYIQNKSQMFFGLVLKSADVGKRKAGERMLSSCEQEIYDNDLYHTQKYNPIF